jgi:phage/plasmid primase-like uncharacterized protein
MSNSKKLGYGSSVRESRRNIPAIPKNIRSALSYVSPDIGRDEWKDILFAVHDALGEDGRDLAEHWSQDGQSYKAADFRATWKSIRPGKGVTVATLWRRALDAGWKPDGETYQETEPERRAREAQRQKRAQEAEQKEARRQAGALLAARKIHGLAHEGPHSYLDLKGVPGAPGLLVIEARAALAIRSFGPNITPDAGPLLIVPMHGPDGALCGLEAIDTKGNKGFLAGCKKGVFIVGAPVPGQPVAIAEGLATGLSVHQATGHAVGVAFDAGSLRRISALIHSQHPGSPILVCGDRGNGEEQARTAAQAVGAAVAIPGFAGLGATGDDTDFNDLHRLQGLGAVREQLGRALAAHPTLCPSPSQSATLLEHTANTNRREQIFSLKRAVFDALRERGAHLDADSLAQRYAESTGLARSFLDGTIGQEIGRLRITRFERPFGLRDAALAAGCEYIETAETWSPSLPEEDGIYIVKSPMGSGKTESLKQAAGQRLGNGGSFAYVAHLQALVGDAALRIGLNDYRADETDLAHGRGIAICVNSLWKLQNTPGFDDVVIDESNQLARRLAELKAGDHCKPALVHAELERLAKRARRLVLVDAQADEMSIAMAQLLKPGEKITVIENKLCPSAGPAKRVTMALKHAGLVGDFHNAVAARAAGIGGRVALCTDSEKEAQGMAGHIARAHPSLKVLTITGRTVGNPEVKAALADINRRIGDYDVVIASPSMTTGVSIESEAFAVFGSYRNGHLATQDALQAVCRFRRATSTHVFVRRGSRPDSIGSEQVVDDRKRRAAMAGYDLPDDGSFRCEIFKRAHDHAGRSAMNRELFLWYADEAGWAIEFQEGDVETGQNAIETGRELEEERYRERVSSAKPLTPEAYAAVARKLERTESEIFEAERHEIEGFYRTPLSKAIFDLDRRGRGRASIMLLEQLNADPASVLAYDRQQAADPAFCFERWRSSAAQVELMALVFRAVGLPERLDPRGAGVMDGRLTLGDAPAPEWTADTLNHDTLEEIWRRRVEFKAQLGVMVPTDFDQAPLKFLNRMISSKAGLKVATWRPRREARQYRLDASGVMALRDAMIHRTEALIVDEACHWPTIAVGLGSAVAMVEANPLPLKVSTDQGSGSAIPPLPKARPAAHTPADLAISREVEPEVGWENSAMNRPGSPGS